MYLISCTFSDNMAQRPIYQASDAKLVWGHRIYYINAPSLPKTWGQSPPISEKEITPHWTFQGTWKPDWQGIFPTPD